MQKSSLLGMLVVALVSIGNVSADHIDTFEGGNFLIATSSFDSNTQFLSPTDNSVVQGNVRLVEVTATGGGNAIAQIMTGPIRDDSIVMATDSLTSGLIALSYGGYASTGDLNLDILNISPASQWTNLSLEYISSTSGNATVTLASNGGLDVATATASYSPGTSSLVFNYSSFIASNAAIDLSDIDSIRVETSLSNGALPASLSYSVFERGGVIAIPEPASSAVVLLSTMGLFLRRKRG